MFIPNYIVKIKPIKMLQANELRIGNYVFHKYGGNGINEVIEVTDATFEKFGRPGYSSFYEPIPLTEEWLLSFGFEFKKDAGNWKEPEYRIFEKKYFKLGEKDKKFFWYNYSNDDYYSEYSPELRYVHKLQNLYFALTNQELKIKL